MSARDVLTAEDTHKSQEMEAIDKKSQVIETKKEELYRKLDLKEFELQKARNELNEAWRRLKFISIENDYKYYAGGDRYYDKVFRK